MQITQLRMFQCRKSDTEGNRRRFFSVVQKKMYFSIRQFKHSCAVDRQAFHVYGGLLSFWCKLNLNSVSVFFLVQYGVDLNYLERPILPACPCGLGERIQVVNYKLFDEAYRFEQRRLAATVRTKQNLLLRRLVFEVDKTEKVVDVDTGQHGHQYTAKIPELNTTHL